MSKNTMHLKRQENREEIMDNIVEQNEEQDRSVGGANGNNNVRLNLLEEISRQTEGDKMLGELTDDETSPKEPDKEPDKELDKEPEPENTEPEPDDNAPDETVTITVDGKSMQVSRKNIEDAGIRALQKDSTADRRLEEATRILTEAKQIPATSLSTDAVSAEEAELIRAIQVGEPEEAAKAIRQLQQQSRVTQDELSLVVDARLSFNHGVQWLQTEAKDVMSDPRMRRQIVYEEQVLRQNGDSRPHIEVYKELVADLRKWRGVSTQTLDEKRDKKAATVEEPPKANATQSQPKDDDDDGDDTQSWLTAQRKARGRVT